VAGGFWEPPTVADLGRLLPQYRIDRLIGRGGMGAVYKGVQLNLDREVAIKLLPVEIAADAEFVARFEREARTLARLNHACIVTIHDLGRTGEGHLYFVMEYVDGTNLREVLLGPGLEPEQALAVVGHLCDALQVAHRAGIVHRDIKPENVLLTTEGDVKLADFGLARPTQEAGTSALTNSNVIMGTPDYMAPEQRFDAAKADHRADIFALGVMFYEMLTGQRPHGVFAPPSQKVQVDVRIDEVVLKALQSEPDRRYQQVTEMKSDMERIRTTPLPASVRGEPRGVRSLARRHKTLLAIAASLAAILGAGGYVTWFKGSHHAPAGHADVSALATPAAAANSSAGGSSAKAQTPNPPIASAQKPVATPQSATASLPSRSAPAAVVWTEPAIPGDKRYGEARSIFNGKDLTGWMGRPEFWSVEDGAITGTTTAGNQPKGYTSLIWHGGQVTDFELTYKFKIVLDEGNRALKPDGKVQGTRCFGVQFRGIVSDRNYFTVAGYFSEVDPDHNWTGHLLEYSAHGFGTSRGQKSIVRDGVGGTTPIVEKVGSVGDWGAIGRSLKVGDWNESRIVCVGNHIEMFFNGRQTVDVLDERSNRVKSGVLSLGIMRNFDNVVSKVQYKDIWLKDLRESSAVVMSNVPSTPVAASGKGMADIDYFGATKEKPFINSLGMRFVPVPITGGATNGRRILFSVWDTRIQDYEQYAQAKGITPQKPSFEQGAAHPVVNVSWNDAKAFCSWLTERERALGKIGAHDEYRLPLDHEWSCAVGIGKLEDPQMAPQAKDKKIPGYPWGAQWPPPKGAGNFCDEAAEKTHLGKHGIAGYDDGFAYTSPVGSFSPNDLGLFDMSGNVWQWCEDWYDSEQKMRSLRGGSWSRNFAPNLRSSSRFDHGEADQRHEDYGFRCVLDVALAELAAGTMKGAPLVQASMPAPVNPSPIPTASLLPAAVPGSGASAKSSASYLACLAEQLPSIGAWAFAPMNVPTPSSVPASLNRLRAGLQAESRTNPAAFQSAYERGMGYCDLALGTMREKDRFIATSNGKTGDWLVSEWKTRLTAAQPLFDGATTQFRDAMRAVSSLAAIHGSVDASVALPTFPVVPPPPPKAPPIPAPLQVEVRGAGPAGTNFGWGDQKMKMHIDVSCNSATPVAYDIDCYWVGWNGKHHTTGAAKHFKVSLSEGHPFVTDIVAAGQRTNGVTQGILGAAPGAYRGWIISVHDGKGDRVGLAANMPEFAHLVP